MIRIYYEIQLLNALLGNSRGIELMYHNTRNLYKPSAAAALCGRQFPPYISKNRERCRRSNSQ